MGFNDIVYRLSQVGLTFDEGAPSSLRLFSQMNLSIYSGETFVVLGPIGVGKSSLLKLLAGLIAPTEGTLHLWGEELNYLTPDKLLQCRVQMGMSFQRNGLFDSLTCGENLMFLLRELTDLKEKERKKKVQEALNSVGLAEIGPLQVNEISGGMQKRLGLARAFLLAPKLALLDDPTAGLDPVTSREIVELILSLKQKQKMTLVVVTSDVSRAFQMADRIGFLYQGKMEWEGSPTEMKTTEHPVVQQFVSGSLVGPLTEELPA